MAGTWHRTACRPPGSDQPHPPALPGLPSIQGGGQGQPGRRIRASRAAGRQKRGSPGACGPIATPPGFPHHPPPPAGPQQAGGGQAGAQAASAGESGGTGPGGPSGAPGDHPGVCPASQRAALALLATQPGSPASGLKAGVECGRRRAAWRCLGAQAAVLGSWEGWGGADRAGPAPLLPCSLPGRAPSPLAGRRSVVARPR